MPRRKPLPRGPWDDPISPLQAARFDLRRTRQEIVDLVHQLCPGRGGQECKLDADKLGEYERGTRRPGIDHVTAFCRIYQRSAEALGLIHWRDQPAGEAETGAAGSLPEPRRGAPSGHGRQDHPEPYQDAPATAATGGANGTIQTVIRYPGSDVESQLLTLSGDAFALPIGIDVVDQTAAAERELEVGTAVRRSQFIKTMGTAAGAAMADPVIAVAQRVHDEINFTKVSTAEIDRLAEAAHHHARGYYQLNDLARSDALVLDWAAAGRLIGLPATQRQRRQLFDIYGRLCGILGFLCFDRGEISRAKVLLETGQAAAREIGGGDLLAWLLDRSSLLAEQAENDPGRVVSLTGRGLDAAGGQATPIAAKLHGRMARAYAALGDRAGALASLDEAETSLASASPGCWPAEPGMPRGFTFAPDVLAIDIGEVHLRLGDLTAAAAACERATILLEDALGPQAGTKSSAVPQSQFNLAMALARAGELDGACEVAAGSLARYEGVAKTVVIRRARRFEGELAAYQPNAHMRAFSELLRDRERRMLEAPSSGA